MIGAWALILSLLEVAAVVWLVRRVYWRRYPALLLYLVGDAAAIATTVLFAQNWTVGWLSSQPLRMALRAFFCFEILYLGCVRLNRSQKARAIAAMAVSSVVAGAATALVVGLTPWQSFLIFRQYFHLELAALAVGLSIHLWRNPIAENSEHRAYRTIGTLMLVRIALSGMFVTGGLGYLIFPYTGTTWRLVDYLSWFTAALLVVLLPWRMTRSFSSQPPNRAYGGAPWH
jgi:hypothetical protein